MKPLTLAPDNVPEELRAIDSWLLWKIVKSHKADGEETWLKVPYYASGFKRKGALGTKTDRQKLTSFDNAMRVFRRGGYAGIGFATMPDYPLTILDLDKCIDADTGEYSKFAQRVIKTGTYVERSPSGFGLRAVYTGGAVCQGKRNGHIDGGERVEIYCGSAFVTITGRVVDEKHTKPIDLPKGIKRTLEPVIAGNGSGTQSAAVEVDGEMLMSPDAGPLPEFEMDHARVVLNKLPETWGTPGHGTWYRVAAALHLQFDGSEDAYTLLDEWSQGLDGYDPEANRRRWDAGFSHGGGKEGLTTMRNLVFESIQNGGMRVKADTMQKWGLGRRVVEEDFEPEVDEPSLPEFADLRRMANIHHKVTEDAPPVEWLVENFIPRGAVTVLSGGSGTSKSYVTLQVCGAGAVGMPSWGGMKIVEGGFKTLYMGYEDSDNGLHVRVNAVAKYIGDHVDILGDGAHLPMLEENFLALSADTLDSGCWQLAQSKKRFEPLMVTATAAYLREFIQTEGIDLVVFDTGSEIHSGQENDASDMVVLMRVLRQMAASANCAVLVIQHVSKEIWKLKIEEMNQASIRGSSVLVDKARNVVMLARMPRADAVKYGLPDTADTHDDFIVLKHVKANLGPYLPLKVLERTHNGLLIYRQEITEQAALAGEFQSLDATVEQEEEAAAQRRQAALDRDRDAILEFLKAENAKDNFPSTNQILFKTNIPANRGRALVVFLGEEGLIEKVDDPAHPKSHNWRVK
jgi:RecA-family ATPase